MTAPQILAVLFEIAVFGVGVVCVLVGGWSIFANRVPHWLWLALVPADAYVRWWGAAALLLGAGSIIVVLASSPSSPMADFVNVGFGLQVLALGIWFYVRSRSRSSAG